MANWFNWWTVDRRTLHLRNKREPRAVCGERLGSKARIAFEGSRCKVCADAEVKLRSVSDAA